MSSLTRLAVALAAWLLVPSASCKACPPLGPVLPPPQAPSRSEAVKSAVQNLASGLDAQFTSKFKATGLSIGVKSIHEDEQLFSYHFTPPVLSGLGGSASIDENTIYRVGSLSKMFPALAALQSSSINMDDSVLKYIPELRNATGTDPTNTSPWEDITVGSLANHLSGLATDTAMDLAIFPAPWTDMGLPNIAKGTGPECSGLPGTKACTRQNLINDLKRRPPVYLPYTSPVYSNVGFAILALVIEAATGKPFEDVIRTGIYDVVGMESTSFDGPVKAFLERGFVPMGEPTWNVTLGVFEAAGGMFSNTVDLLAFAEGILTNSFLSPRRTRQWLKPDTHTSSWGSSVGAPWEILRSDTITADGRLIDVFTKSGDLGLYHAYLALIPDYDIVISILTGGVEVSTDQYANTKIFSAVVEALIPAVEQAGREEASSAGGLVGTYTDTSTGSSITLELDAGPGLLITNFTVRGFDVLNHATQYSLSSGTSSTDDVFIEGRMYPTNLVAKQSGDNQTERTAWRTVFDTMTEEEKTELEGQLFFKNGSCLSWFELDRAAYNFLSLWDFVFVRGADGRIKAIQNPAFNVTMTKVSKCHKG